MFGKRKERINDTRADTLIGPGTEAVGDILFRGGMRIEGVVRGNVKAVGDGDATLVLTEKSRVEGTVDAPTVVASGTIHGDVHARKRADLKATAHIEGDVHYNSLAMEQGAVINGNLYCEGIETAGPAGASSTGVSSAGK